MTLSCHPPPLLPPLPLRPATHSPLQTPSDVQLRRSHSSTPPRQVPLLRRRRNPHRCRGPPHHCGISVSPVRHLSRALFHNRPFHLKYQLPNEDLDSLISVITDEDLSNMLDEHDRISPPPASDYSSLPSSLSLWKGQSADAGLLLGIGSDLDAPVENGCNSGGGDVKLGAESLVLETSSSFGSTSSSFSMSNSPPIGVVNCDEKGLNLLDRKTMLHSSASVDSENGVGSLAAPQKAESLQAPLIQVGPVASSENPVYDSSFNITTQKTVQLLGYPLSQQPDGKKLQHETQLIQGGLQYVPQYAGPVPFSPYYPVYQMPMHPQHILCPPNQPYPVYWSLRPPLHPQTAAIAQPVAHKEVFGAQIAESATKVYCSIPAATQVVSIPSNQGQLVVGTHEPQIATEQATPASVISATQGGEFDEDIAYNPIYKTQPSAPLLASQYQTMTKGTMMLPEPSVQQQPNHAKQQA
ncbi:UNVERIFIED_CONTAM: hypothetical protein Slati_1559700 [Sesamum latifolium]|uniref:PB1 domain-containing protein n=1 Tax=Sesamum latifolium TaxID=2727402 RepID=A0AAW2X836_9LAMI